MQHQHRVFGLLAVLGYILAAVVLVSGLICTISIVSGAARLDGTSFGLPMLGLGELSGLVVGPLRRALFTAGSVVFVASIVLSGLAYAAGRLLAAMGDLSARVCALEARETGAETVSTQAPPSA